MKKSILFFSTIVGLLIFGCSTRVSSEILIFNLKSYSSVLEIKELIASKNGIYEVAASRLSDLDNQEKSEITIIKTNLFNYSGYTGETRMTFWNNKLMEVAFFPKKDIEYMKYFKKEKNINSSNIKENRNLHIEIIKDYKGNYYAIFTDIRLTEEMDNWIRKYS